MKTLKQTTTDQNGSRSIQQEADAHPDNCRCKEVSEKTPGELLKLMMHDLAFWRKGKKEGA